MKIKLTVGSILKKHGAWHWRYYGPDGKQKSVKLADVSDQYRSKQDVIPVANQMAGRILPRGEQPRTGNVTIVDFAETVYLPWVAEQKRPATFDGYRKMWTAQLKSHFGTRRLYEYEPYHATEFLTSLARKGLGRYHVGHIRGLMSSLFGHAIALGHIRMNPIHDAKLLVAPKPPAQTQHYTVEEMRAILAALSGEPQTLAIMALAFLGLNRAEIRGVQWADVDTANGVVRIRRSVWGKHVSEGGKSERRKRDVTIGPLMIEILEHYRATQPTNNIYVFENSARNPLDLGSYSARVIRPLLEKYGLKWKGYHAGRRGAETEMNRFTNGNSQITAHHFGHTKQVADAHYVKPLPDETRRVALAFDLALSDGNKGQQETVSTQVAGN
jgi:integrase